jgi:hypothetical protein
MRADANCRERGEAAGAAESENDLADENPR